MSVSVSQSVCNDVTWGLCGYRRNLFAFRVLLRKRILGGVLRYITVQKHVSVLEGQEYVQKTEYKFCLKLMKNNMTEEKKVGFYEIILVEHF